MTRLEQVRQGVIDAARCWRDAKCSRQPGRFGFAPSQTCRGDEHVMDCDVTLARIVLIDNINYLDKCEDVV